MLSSQALQLEKLIMLILLTLVTVLTYLAYKWSTSTYDYFEKQGIPYGKPFPFIGSNAYLFIKRKNFVEILQNWYYEFKDEK